MQGRERVGTHCTSKEEYANRLSLRFAGITPYDLKKGGTFSFSVTDAFTIFVTNRSHMTLYYENGVNPDSTFVEGYISTREDKDPIISFKDQYQPVKAFTGTVEEELNLKNAIRDLILRSI